LEGTDGKDKMSKSYNNYIGLTDSPDDQYGRTLSIPDDLIGRYFEFATEISSKELKNIYDDLDKGISNPRDLKRRLAREIVALYHCEDAAKMAENRFDALFINKGEPEDMPLHKLNSSEKLVDLMVNFGFASSNGEARRLISQGGVSVNKERIDDVHTVLYPGKEVVIKVGKRRFLKVN